MGNNIRIGRISSVNPESGNVRVVYADKDNEVTKEFPVFNFNGEYKMPAVDDMVIVLHLSNGTSAGIVLGTYWNAKQKPAESGMELFRKEFAQAVGEAFLQYKDGELFLKAPQFTVQTDDWEINAKDLIGLFERVRRLEEAE